MPQSNLPFGCQLLRQIQTGDELMASNHNHSTPISWDCIYIDRILTAYACVPCMAIQLPVAITLWKLQVYNYSNNNRKLDIAMITVALFFGVVCGWCGGADRELITALIQRVQTELTNDTRIWSQTTLTLITIIIIIIISTSTFGRRNTEYYE